MRVHAICLIAGARGAIVPSPAPPAAAAAEVSAGGDSAGGDDGPLPDVHGADGTGNVTLVTRRHSLINYTAAVEGGGVGGLVADVFGKGSPSEVEGAQRVASLRHHAELTKRKQEMEPQLLEAQKTWKESVEELKTLKKDMMKINKELRYRERQYERQHQVLMEMISELPGQTKTEVTEEKKTKKSGFSGVFTGGLLLQFLLMVYIS